MKMLVNLALTKTVVLGIEKVGKTWEKMVTNADGQGWVVRTMMAHLNGKKRY